MSFSCPHFEYEKDYCLKLATDCVAGRPGCVLRNTSVFYVPAEDRLKPGNKSAPHGNAVAGQHPAGTPAPPDAK